MERNSIDIWVSRLEKIKRGETVMNEFMIKPEPYFGTGMDKERQIAFCELMIENLKARKS